MELSQIDGQVFVSDCPGLALGPFLKKGGQKSVWRCAFRDKAYVLKAIMASDRASRRFVREIEIMKSCDSPYLPKFGPIPLRELSVPPAEKVMYFLEEYIEGIPLASAIMPASVAEVVALGRCIAKALTVLAKHRYVHRDVKPMNIIQQTSSTYVLIDPGLALDLDGDVLSVVGTGPVGTRAYYSPEQIALPSPDLDGRSDLFSLGVTMYQFATGEHPFWNDALPQGDIVRNIERLAPPDPREFVPILPDNLCNVISRLLQKDREARYPSAELLLAHLNELS